MQGPGAEPWLRELYLALAAQLRDARLVPAILQSALHGGKREQELAIDALAQITAEVRTKQVAPTIVKALGLDPEALDAARLEHTSVLPDLF